MNCGPGVNNGQGTFTNDAATYVDIYNYMDWIKKTMNGMYIKYVKSQNFYFVII